MLLWHNSERCLTTTAKFDKIFLLVHHVLIQYFKMCVSFCRFFVIPSSLLCSVLHSQVGAVHTVAAKSSFASVSCLIGWCTSLLIWSYCGEHAAHTSWYVIIFGVFSFSYPTLLKVKYHGAPFNRSSHNRIPLMKPNPMGYHSTASLGNNSHVDTGPTNGCFPVPRDFKHQWYEG